MAVLSISGLRGIIGKDLFNDDITEILYDFILSSNIKTCAIGRDTRTTSNMIYETVSSVLIALGCQVEDLGVTSTPSVFRHVKKNDLDGGICITSSHNPKEWNGLKLIIRPGRIINPTELTKQSIKKYKFTGTIKESASSYDSDLIEFFNKDKFHKLKIAMDFGGGAGSTFVRNIFAKLGCEVYAINEFPGIFTRTINPTEDSLESLSKLITSKGCKIGFAFDADVDRLVIMNEKGEKIAPGIRLIVIPATMKVYQQALKEGLIDTFIDAGGVVSPSTCGPCPGLHQGVMGPKEAGLFTTNRNFRGRTGHPEAEIYLASPYTAAATAITGTITDPREV